MTRQTLTAERRDKFEIILREEGLFDLWKDSIVYELIDRLVLASLSRTERATDETAAEYNAELFRGDWREYPEHLHETARILRDVWKFVLPAKPQKKVKEFSKGAYGMFCYSMEKIKQSCGEFGVERVLTALHEDWVNSFKDGIAPYTIAQPTSLVNVANGKAREMRESGGIAQKTEVVKSFPKRVNGRIVNE